MGRFVRTLAILAGVVFLPATVFAQASFLGVVRDTSGAVLPGVTVEAASPVLIEKVRTAVTDGNGRYQIVDLRPGAYTVTFTLAGFNTVKRDGVTLSGAARVDRRRRAARRRARGNDHGHRRSARSSTSQTTTRQPVAAAPTWSTRCRRARNYLGLARMIPGTRSAAATTSAASQIQDVGGSLTVHGSRAHGSARDAQRHQHDDAAGRRQHRRPDRRTWARRPK